MVNEPAIRKGIIHGLHECLAFQRYQARIAREDGTITQEDEDAVIEITKEYYWKIAGIEQRSDARTDNMSVASATGDKHDTI